MNEPLPAPARKALQNLINRALALDPKAESALAELNGRHFRVECTSPVLVMTLAIRDSQVVLGDDSAEQFDTTLTGRWTDFVEVATAQDPGSALINSAVQVRGDTAYLLELRRILAGLDLDWEAPLARLIGDVAAHQIGDVVRGGGRLLGRLFGRAREQVGRYVKEQEGLLPDEAQAEAFYTGIGELTEKVDACEARLKGLASRAQALQQKRNGD